MRIRRVTVTKLFGIFDHDIELNAGEHITILSGPNGHGKTILLRMIDSFLRRRYGLFRRIPFQSFQITFEDGRFLRIEPHEDRGNEAQLPLPEEAVGAHRASSKIMTTRSPQVRLRVTSHDHKLLDVPLLPEPSEFRSRFIPTRSGRLERLDSDTWLDVVTEEVMTWDQVIDRYGDELPGLRHPRRESGEWLREFLDTVDVRLIETQRLDITNEDPRARSYRDRRPTVLRYTVDLAERVQRLLTRYASRSQELDRTFPTRILQQAAQPLTAAALRDKLAAIEEKRAHLTALGFLAREQQLDIPTPEAVEKKLDVLSVYVADVEQKLAVFDEMAAKAELLTRIVNDLFLYKRMHIDSEAGFVFTSSTGHRVEPDNLSSGEQHQLVLLYELLFQSPEGSLVLIDEPEISLHAAWQERFLDDLTDIVALSKFDVLVATHSAEIIGTHWDLVVELRGPDLPAHPLDVEQAS